ncbi:hypothetical protein PWYN_02165 [Paenibacillus wynnii]|uniref:Uncharacterized protein n=1 Tax=Paenibacillus wynnii TaxID=268407 RepID=A0A098MHG7_9BACL|nr:hypothetical protein PWYN_02165 [Paenibacillus wynnii]
MLLCCRFTVSKNKRTIPFVENYTYGTALFELLFNFSTQLKKERREILELEKRSVRLYPRIFTAKSGSNQEIQG